MTSWSGGRSRPPGGSGSCCRCCWSWATPTIALVLDLPYAGVAAVYVVTGMGSAYLLGLQRRFLVAVPSELQGQGFALLTTATMTIQGSGPWSSGCSPSSSRSGSRSR